MRASVATETYKNSEVAGAWKLSVLRSLYHHPARIKWGSGLAVENRQLMKQHVFADCLEFSFVSLAVLNAAVVPV